MLKKFTDGLIFGAGFGIALAAILCAWIVFVLPRALDTLVSSSHKTPQFDNPKQAEVFQPDPSITAKKDFSFFKDKGERMQIPFHGGILAMSPMQTPSNAKRPSTYQLWLTENSLWQIRTTEDKVEIEPLARPQDANVESLDKLMNEKLGLSARQSTMTISDREIESLKSSAEGAIDSALNGKMTLSKEGVVFVLPNAF